MVMPHAPRPSPGHKHPRAPAIRRFAIPAATRSPGPVMGSRAQRTRALILDTARELFVNYGYPGTTIDRIAREAGMSRASVYTYYPTKRDILLATGETAFAESEAVIAELGRLPARARGAELEGWVRSYMDFLERHGAFVLVLAQAVRDDHELRKVGLREYRRLARRLAAELTRLRGAEVPAAYALAVLGVMERFAMWRSSGLDPIGEDTPAVVAGIITALVAAR